MFALGQPSSRDMQAAGVTEWGVGGINCDLFGGGSTFIRGWITLYGADTPP
jgi:hypothetical protein